jgi:hypothetical protein
MSMKEEIEILKKEIDYLRERVTNLENRPIYYPVVYPYVPYTPILPQITYDVICGRDTNDL